MSNVNQFKQRVLSENGTEMFQKLITKKLENFAEILSLVHNQPDNFGSEGS